MKIRILLTLVCGTGIVSFASADHHENTPLLTAAFNIYDGAQTKVLSLARAIPEEKYNWRPSEGVRSVREAIVHIAAGNYFIGSMMGAAIPEGINPRELEKSITTREQAIAALEQSSAFVREAMKNVPEDEYGEEIDLFGRKAPKVQLLLLVMDHTSEHLGQLIAYARSNNITPPWSVKQSG